MAATTQSPPSLRTWLPGALAGSGAAMLSWVALDAVTTVWPRALPPEALALTIAVAAGTTVVIAWFGDVGAARWALLVTTAAIALGIAAAAVSPATVQVRQWSPHPLEILARGAHSIGPYLLLGVWAALSVSGIVRGRRGARG